MSEWAIKSLEQTQPWLLYRRGSRFGSGLLGGHGDGQADHKMAALAGFALDLDSAVVGGDDPRHEAQTQSQTLRLVGLGIAHTIKAVEDVRQIFRRNAHAVILHFQPDPAV